MAYQLKEPLSNKYDLVANICHDLQKSSTDSGSNGNGMGKKAAGATITAPGRAGLSDPPSSTSGHSGVGTGSSGVTEALDAGSYRTHMANTATGQWYEARDLKVVETLPQLISISESYILFYKRKDV